MLAWLWSLRVIVVDIIWFWLLILIGHVSGHITIKLWMTQVFNCTFELKICYLNPIKVHFSFKKKLLYPNHLPFFMKNSGNLFLNLTMIFWNFSHIKINYDVNVTIFFKCPKINLDLKGVWMKRSCLFLPT